MGQITIYEGATKAWDNGPGTWVVDPDKPHPIVFLTSNSEYTDAPYQSVYSYTVDYFDTEGGDKAILTSTNLDVVLQITATYPFLPPQVEIGGLFVDAYPETRLPEGRGDYLTDIEYSENGVLTEKWEDFRIKINTALLYLGTDLYGEYIFRYDDTIIGSSKSERIFGYEGNDGLFGGAGDDYLDAGSGDNEVYGEAGNDTIIGYNGDQTFMGNLYSGGSGVDTVVLFGKASDYSVSSKKGLYDSVIYVAWENGDSIGRIETDVEFIQFSDIRIDTSNLAYIGDVQRNVDWDSTPNGVHRFYNNRDKAFFYTSSEAEKDYVLDNSTWGQPDGSEWPYVYQGSTFKVASTYPSEVPLFRFYNYQTGHHFFTADPEERDFVLSKSNSGEWPFNYEGVAFNVYAGDPTPSYSGYEVPVHRFYSPELDRHFFTASEEEVQQIQLTGQWNYEGIGFWGEVV